MSHSSRVAPGGWHRQFQALMPFRVREILLASSAYDAFVLEEDGSLSDRLFYEYSELSLSWAPRLTHAASHEAVLELLDHRRFDLVLLIVRLGGGDAEELSRMIKKRHPGVPVVLLIFDQEDLRQFPGGVLPPTIDRVFLWGGTSGVLIAAIKSIEDDRNVAHDVAAGVQVVLVVEDRVRAYSNFLAILYPELLNQSGSLIAEGLNDFHRLMRMRARPKVLLATSFEEAVSLYRKYASNLSGLMSDMRIPRAGKLRERGGLELARLIREDKEELPILFQSAEKNMLAEARAFGAWFIPKNAPDFRARVRAFLKEALGFGDFVFRLPDRTEVARARDVFELERALKRVPVKSVAYHAARNHFSVWLRARSLFQLAASVQAQSAESFESTEAMREDLIGLLVAARTHGQEGVITDLSSRHTGPQNRFVRVGRGSIGGKGRGIAFVSTQIVRHGLLRRFPELQIRIPKTVVLGTDSFDAFMEQFDIQELDALRDDAAITERMLTGSFRESDLHQLWTAFENLGGPLAVRSSTLLEDSRFQPFAGVYATYMLPNNDPDVDFRFHELLRAIKAVYASVFWRDARTYLAGTPHDIDDQKMAVVIQQVVGGQFGTRHYPALSGVAQSHNNYPVGGQRPEDGVAHIALGLGHTVVSGGVALRFSPGAPTVLPQYPTPEAFLEGSQRSFFAIDLSRPELDVAAGPESTLVSCDLDDAEADGCLALCGSVYCLNDNVIRENLSLPFPRMVTFNNVLKWNSLPLASALATLLKLLREGIGEEVEIEFAVDSPATKREGRTTLYPSDPRTARLYVLQMRPMAGPTQHEPSRSLDDFADSALLCRTDVALGHGSVEGVRDIVFAQPERFQARRSRKLAERVGELNDMLTAKGRPYVLIGPGRWGSSDSSLGIGVSWCHISGARVIVEIPLGDRVVEPSQGTHFFRNVTAAGVGYLTITDSEKSWIDSAWLRSLVGSSKEDVLHIRLEAPLGIVLDGRRGAAVIVRPRLGASSEPP